MVAAFVDGGGRRRRLLLGWDGSEWREWVPRGGLVGRVRIQHGGSGEQLDDIFEGRRAGSEDSGGFVSGDVGSVWCGDSGDGHDAVAWWRRQALCVIFVSWRVLHWSTR